MFRYAKKNIDINPLKDKVYLYNFGLSNCNKTIKVAYYPFHDYLSSINKNHIDIIDKLEKMEYIENYIKDTADVLKKIIKEDKIDNDIVIKIDTEGSEYDIFDSLLNNYIDIFDKVKLFIGEFHFGTNGIDKKLEDLGFVSYITGRDFIFYRPDQNNM
ncbi:FkbM family methyltransferase [Brachyspira pilosicoli]|uniref:FkbM family methyltransferase n=1 Tax=Brachyspira pilosicoli TaxID=52584 RepID=UPI0030054E3D